MKVARTTEALRNELDELREEVRTQQNLLLAVDTTVEGIAITDREHRYVYMNRSHATIYGYHSPGELIGETWRVLYSAHERERLEREVLPVLAKQGHCRATAVGKRKDGSRFDQEISLKTLDSGGLICVCRDVSHRKETEKALHETEDRLRTVVSNSQIVFWALDADGVFTLSEGKGLEPLGLKPGQVVGQSALELYRDHPEVVDCLHRALSGERFERTTDVGGVVFQTQYIPLVDADGCVSGVCGVSLDITDHVHALEALRESEEKFRTIFNASAVSLWQEDITELEAGLEELRAQGVTDLWRHMKENPGYSARALARIKVLDVNDETVRLYGARDKEEMLLSLNKVFLPESLPVFEEALVALFEGAEVFEAENVAQTLQGEEINTILRIVFPKGQNRLAKNMLVSVMDITDRVRAEEERLKLEAQVRHTQKLESLGVLAGGIAHDFNNILAGVMGNAELALMHLSGESKATKSVHRIVESSKRAAELCKQMLAYSGKGTFVADNIDVGKIVEDMTSLLEVSISKKVRLEYRLDSNLPSVEADASQLRQVIMNLVTNASESIEDEGRMTIATGAMNCNSKYLEATYLGNELPEGRYVFVEVEDTGRGMDPRTMAKIFDPFFTTKFTGRGLGLAAALGIVRRHRGAIRIDSEPGGGTSVRVLFPKLEREDQPAPPPSAGASITPGRGRVLVIDDEAAARGVSKEMLEMAGFTVITADNGRQGVETFEKSPDEIDLVLLDLTMPELNGEETFVELRNLRKDVRVILVSGYDEKEAATRFVGKGLAGFLQKPFHMKTFLDKVRDVLSR